MKRAVGLLVLLVIIAAAAVAGIVWTRLKTPYKGYESSEQYVQIPAGAGAAVIRQRLLDAGLVQDLYLTTAPLPGGESGTPVYPRPLSTRVIVRKHGTGPESGVIFEHQRVM